MGRVVRVFQESIRRFLLRFVSRLFKPKFSEPHSIECPNLHHFLESLLRCSSILVHSPSWKEEVHVRCRSVDFVDVGEYFHQIQENIAWCFRDADGHDGRPLRTFDAPIGMDGLMDPQMPDAEIAGPPLVIQEHVDM